MIGGAIHEAHPLRPPTQSTTAHTPTHTHHQCRASRQRLDDTHQAGEAGRQVDEAWPRHTKLLRAGVRAHHCTISGHTTTTAAGSSSHTSIHPSIHPPTHRPRRSRSSRGRESQGGSTSAVCCCWLLPYTDGRTRYFGRPKVPSAGSLAGFRWAALLAWGAPRTKKLRSRSAGACRSVFTLSGEGVGLWNCILRVVNWYVLCTADERVIIQAGRRSVGSVVAIDRWMDGTDSPPSRTALVPASLCFTLPLPWFFWPLGGRPRAW